MKKALNTTLCTIAMMLLAATMTAQTASGDESIIRQLKALDINYEVASSGNIKVTFKVDGGRTQLVVIKSKPYAYKDIDVREMYSVAARTSDLTEFSQKNLRILMTKNYENKIGHWQIDGTNTPYTLEFSVRTDPHVSNSTLKELLELCAKQADAMEQEITTGDEN